MALNFLFPSRQVSPRDNFDVSLETQARSKRRSTHVPNLTDELGTAEERLSLVRQVSGAANNVKFGRVCRIMRRGAAADSYGVLVMCRT